MKISTVLTYLSTLVVLLTIILGGLVHATGSGLACPDWPLCFGKMMPKMQGAVLIEHSHRLIAGSAGVLIWLTGLAYWFDNKRTYAENVLVLSAMVLVVIQSLFGGLTVLMNLPDWISTTHFSLANITLLTLVVLCWSSTKQRSGDTSGGTFFDRVLVIGGFAFIFVQMVLGAWLRHIGTSGSPFNFNCETFPICDPVWTDVLPTYYEITYWSHRYLAVIVTVIIVWTAFRFFRHYRSSHPTCYHLTLINAGLVYVQVLLGVLTVRSFLAVVPVTLHLATAIMLVMSQLILVLEYTDPDFFGY